MVKQIIFFSFLGLPLIVWGGMLTLLLFLFTAMIGYVNNKGIIKPPIFTLQTHKTLAIIAIILGLVHGLLGILSLI